MFVYPIFALIDDASAAADHCIIAKILLKIYNKLNSERLCKVYSTTQVFLCYRKSRYYRDAAGGTAGGA
jgi:hypothetical protein